MLEVRLSQAAPIPLDVEFDAPGGEVTALYGPSGSGKSTILRTIAGLYTPRCAFVRCDGVDWTNTEHGRVMAPEARRVGLVFQDYALFPHMSVTRQLIAAMDHLPHEERAGRATALINSVHLDGYEQRRPGELSGGQQQRVAIARALARDPTVLLLDEPFASVDVELRGTLQRELAELRRALNVPVVLVTHDFSDVARLASKVVMIEQGKAAGARTVTQVTAAHALPGVTTHRDPAVVLDTVVASHDPSRCLSRVECGELSLQLPLVPVAVGAAVRVQIAAREVILATRVPEGLSLHNVVPVVIAGVDASDARGMRLVRMHHGVTPLLATVTTDAVTRLELAKGREILALVKAVSVEVIG